MSNKGNLPKMLNQSSTPLANLRRLTDHLEKCFDCHNCGLSSSSSSARVIFRGVAPAEVLIVGGTSNDVDQALGRPMAGAQEDLLNQWLDKAEYQETYYCITNAIICSPQDSLKDKLRLPLAGEMRACSPNLSSFIDIVNPKVIVAAGKIAKKSLAYLPLIQPIIDIPHPASVLKQGERGLLDGQRAVNGLIKALTYAQ